MNPRKKPSQGQPALHVRHLIYGAALVAAMGVCGGCYERTVSAKGLGATGMTIQPSNRSNTALDRWYDRVTSEPTPQEKRMTKLRSSPTNVPTPKTPE